MSIQNAQNDIINLGRGLELVALPVTINPLTDGNLIPENTILTQNSTREIELTYTVRLNAGVQEAFYLFVTVRNIRVNEVENPFNLIDIEISHHDTIANDDVLATLTVRIDDSGLQEENYEEAYNLLSGKNISFEVHFEITPIV